MISAGPGHYTLYVGDLRQAEGLHATHMGMVDKFLRTDFDNVPFTPGSV